MKYPVDKFEMKETYLADATWIAVTCAAQDVGGVATAGEA